VGGCSFCSRATAQIDKDELEFAKMLQIKEVGGTRLPQGFFFAPWDSQSKRLPCVLGHMGVSGHRADFGRSAFWILFFIFYSYVHTLFGPFFRPALIPAHTFSPLLPWILFLYQDVICEQEKKQSLPINLNGLGPG
jgi:hypothetical protein